MNDKMSSTNGRRRSETFQKGDLVLLHRDAAGKNYSKEKLANLYVGPFTILVDTPDIALRSMVLRDRDEICMAACGTAGHRSEHCRASRRVPRGIALHRT